MVTLFIKHDVSDYGKWKAVYDSFAQKRKAYGVVGANVWREAHSPQTIIVTHDFNTLAEATALASAEEMKAVMGEAGVISAPEISFGEAIEHTAH